MIRISHGASLALALCALAACGAPPRPASSTAANPTATHENLSKIFDRYWDERVPDGKPLSPQFLADSLALERRFLAEVSAVPREPLSGDAGLNYDIFKRQRELEIERLTYPSELLPLNPFAGVPQQLARAAAEMTERPPPTAEEFEDWQPRIDDYLAWSRQAIVNMREGLRRGYTSPRVLMERVLPILQDLGQDGSGNVFNQMLRRMPDTIKDPERTRLSMSLAGGIKDRLLPAYRELHDFIQQEYLPRARASIALSALPLGPAWYANSAKRATGTQLTPSEIHAVGLAEVARIQTRLASLPAAAPATGVVDLLNAYRELKAQTLAALPNLFNEVPHADIDIRPFGPSMSTIAAPLFYEPAVPGRGISAVLYVDTPAGPARGVHVDTAGFLQEALPGRHFQAALQRERSDLPRFRRFATESAYVDGWALYAASLGEELGVYGGDEAKRGAALGQLTCAAALVVDTGIHAKDWTRAEAAGYLRAQLAVSDAEATLMTDRFVAFPGEALACKMGELKMQALRRRAEEVQGARFDIRAFHAEILKDGAMPLDILEAKMRPWIEAQH